MAKVPLSEAVREYLEHCRARGMAPATQTLRASSLRRMQEVLGNKLVWLISPIDIDKVFTAHAGRWSDATRNQKVTHYKVFFSWCRARGYVHRDSDPLFGWKMGKLERPDRMRIPQDEWWQLFEACETPVERIIIACGLYLFVRSNELARITVGDVRLDRAEVAIYRSKTRDHDVMPIVAELDEHLRAHLMWLASQGAAQPEHHLVPGREKPRFDPVTHSFMAGAGVLNPLKPHGRPYAVVQRVLSRAGYSSFREGGHTLRRSGARAYFDELAESGYDGALRRVQSMLGHSSSAMTELYLGLDLDRRTRNTELAGRRMFAPRPSANVIQLRKGS